ncbi:hypothetical protein MKY24_10885 [Paenibacillus sp. FSL P2-0322]|uniref:hypothetical protein n=1 Tax=Paenibacillus sp. FSL P2-0322 TaxID=2921628 RepID=UPI0030CD3CD4
MAKSKKSRPIVRSHLTDVVRIPWPNFSAFIKGQVSMLQRMRRFVQIHTSIVTSVLKIPAILDEM